MRILLVLVLLAFLPLASALIVDLAPGETAELPLGGSGIFRVEWAVRAGEMRVSRAGLAIQWAGEEYANRSWQVSSQPSPKLTWWAPAGGRLKLYADRSGGPAVFDVRIERREGIALPIRIALPPFYSSTVDLVPSTTSKGVEIEGRHRAIAFLMSQVDADGRSLARLVGNEKGDWDNLKSIGAWLYAQGDTIRLHMKNYSGKILYVRGYILLEPLPLDNTTSNAATTPGQEEQPADRSAEPPSSLSPGLLGAGALAGLAIALLLARRG